MLAAAALAGLAPAIASAQRWSVDAGVNAETTWTSNAGLGGSTTGGVASGSGSTGGDEIFNLRPHIRLLAEGERLKLSGSASLSAVTYANGKEPTQLEPDVDLKASLAVIEHFLYLDAGLRAMQTNDNVFGARPQQGVSTDNSTTTTQGRLAPRIEGMTPNLWHYRVLSENSWAHGGDDAGVSTGVDNTGGSGYFGRHSALLEQEPKPFGWRLDAERTQTRYHDMVPSSLTTDLARATVSYAIDTDLALGIRGGVEHTSYVVDGKNRDGIYGADLKWQPSPRTLLSAFGERRYFGSSWQLAFDHHTPQFAFNLTSSRLLETSVQSLLDLPASGNIAALLDSLLASRYPDAIARARAVGDLIAQQGLPTSTLQPISLFGQRLSVVTQSSAAATLIGRRNTLSVTAFYIRTADAPDIGSIATGDPLTNNVQTGGAVVYTHRLSPTMTLIGSADLSRIRALAALGERSTQRSARLRMNVEVLPKTMVYAGGRYVSFSSNSTTSGNEAAVFAGVDHRF